MVQAAFGVSLLFRPVFTGMHRGQGRRGIPAEEWRR